MQQNHRENSVEDDVEKSRRAVERKLMYLSEANHMAGPSRNVRARTSRGGAGEPLATAGGGAQNREASRKVPGANAAAEYAHKGKQAVKKCWQTAYPPQNATEKPSRVTGGHNVLKIESPRRNGLTPRDPLEDLDLTPSELNISRRMHDIIREAEYEEMCLMSKGGNTYGLHRLNSKPLSSYVHGQVKEQEPAPIPQPLYNCNLCAAKFNIRSLLAAHRRTHDDDFKIRFAKKRSKDSTTTLTCSNQCKFCDRKFELERTLHIHQMCHCKKISPQHRRKLQFTELAHEKKAPLPSFERNAATPNGDSGAAGDPGAINDDAFGAPHPDVSKRQLTHFTRNPIPRSILSGTERKR
ncbi:uncharacterized protein Dwil_GK16023 [Drosophila willistoni]|uniref:C2H2-type domain-containing protein n=2 Tax=Drosophila willistoni TaxID=7260 RepID=B4NQ26_DROWI|nr:uncharacterized protein Dwil_GK16023 [Drosophila willistoni]